MAYDITQNQIVVAGATQQQNVTIPADQIMSLKTVEQVSEVGDELAYDTMALSATQSRTLSTSGATYGTDLTDFAYGAEVRHTNVDIDRAFYIEQSNRVGKHAYDYDCVSFIGLLDRQTFKGELFRRSYFSTILRMIIGNSGDLITYTVSNNCMYLTMSGYVPYGTKREALKQLLFASGVHIYVDNSTGNVTFDYLNTNSVTSIADADIFDKGKIEHPQLATKVTVMEHTFFDNDFNTNYVTLYDNSGSNEVTNAEIVFQNAPIIVSSLVTEGNLTLVSATEGCAVVSGRGVLKGRAYLHSTFAIERTDTASGRKEYEVSVTDAYLVSILNGENVADKVADYWFNRYVVKNDVRVNDQVCGKMYSFKDAFLSLQTGFLQKMEKVFSSFIKARCEFVCGLTQDYHGNNYNYGLIINIVNAPNRTGKFKVPSGAKRIRVVLLGGGSSGTSGLAGKNGTSAGEGGDGGEPGTPGQGGAIYEFTIDNPASEYTFELGAGGAQSGATWSQTTHLAGNPGGDTTFTDGSNTWSSASGLSSDVGWCEPFSFVSAARPGGNGIAGGKGGKAGQNSDTESETALRSGEKGEDVVYNGTTYSGGAGGSGVFITAPTSFAVVNGMTATQIYNQGVYVRSGGSTVLYTSSTGLTLGFCTEMKSKASGAITYCNALNWTHKVGIAGGGGGGAAYGNGSISAGGTGTCLSNYPSCVVIDQDNKLRDDDAFCWHEIDTTYGGNGGHGGNASIISLSSVNVSDGGHAGCGGGGGGGAGASPTSTGNIAWFLCDFLPSPTTPAVGSGGYGGSSRPGVAGGISIYCDLQITIANNVVPD